MKILSTSARGILRSGAVRVRVNSTRRVTIRLFATLRARGSHPVTIVITQPRTISLLAGGRRNISLPLVAAGRAELAGCRPRLLEVRARTLRHGVPFGRTSRDRRTLRSGCARHRRGRRPSHGGGTGSGSGSAPARPIRYDTPADADRCDFIDPAVCLQPFPNDYFTIADPTTATKRRLNLNILSMPRNRESKPIDPTDYNRSDGFSPGSSIVTKIPGLDTPAAFKATGAVPITDMGRSFAPNQPVVVINSRTGKRQLIWAELDSNAHSPADVNLIIRPGINFDEGTRYIVALRRLRDGSGRLIPPSSAFRLYRDRILTTNPVVESRRDHFESIFATLADAGIDRGDLYSAWDFTVGSERNLTERILSIRNDAFAKLGDTNLSDLKVQGTAPQFVVTQTTDYAPCGSGGCQNGQSNDLIRQVQGRFVVPCYLNQLGCPPGSQFAYPPGSTHGPPLAIPGNLLTANFICNIPRSAVTATGVRPVRPLLYGHGLLGTADQINGDDHTEAARREGLMFCATDWIGMAQEDIPNAIASLHDVSRFSTVFDRVQQGMVNFMYLGRLMIHPQGFSANPAFQFAVGGLPRSVIDTRRLFYNGDSQGGIIGGALTAVAPDFNRAVLGDTGMNYSTLLQRSSDFGTGQMAQHPDPTDPTSFLPDYAYPLYTSYPNQLERPLIFALLQTLWDRSEADGYAHHMTTDPPPDTPAHSVLMHQPFGDHQVANVASEVEARTIGARMHVPALDPGRSTSVVPYYGIPPITSNPYYGPAAFVTWDIGPLRTENGSQVGTPPPPLGNVPPQIGDDPHGAPHARGQLAAEDQISQFLRIDGSFVDVCGGQPCYAGTWHGPHH